MVIITHEMAVIKAICDKWLLLRMENRGKWAVFDLFTNPHTKTARRFISTINSTELPDVILERQKFPAAIQAYSNFFYRLFGRRPIISDMIKNLT